VRTVKPTDWFNVISNGRLQKGMPPFTSLTADDRWGCGGVSLYAVHFARSIGQGQVVYMDKCAACHGATGSPATRATPDLSDASRMAGKSQADLDGVIANGKGTMPGLASVSQADRQAAADYVRSLSMGLVKLAAAQRRSGYYRFACQWHAGRQVARQSAVTLYALSPDGSSLMFTRTLASDAKGQFVFDKLDASMPIMYGLQTEYLKAIYTSEALSLRTAADAHGPDHGLRDDGGCQQYQHRTDAHVL